MTEFVLFCVPTLIYLAAQTRRKDRSFSSVRARAGLTAGAPASYAWALLMLIPLVLTGWLALTVIPSDVLAMPGVTTMRVTSVGIAVGVVLRAVGEEVLFRGLLGGVLVRRLGFGRGGLAAGDCRLTGVHLCEEFFSVHRLLRLSGFSFRVSGRGGEAQDPVVAGAGVSSPVGVVGEHPQGAVRRDDDIAQTSVLLDEMLGGVTQVAQGHFSETGTAQVRDPDAVVRDHGPLGLAPAVPTASPGR